MHLPPSRHSNGECPNGVGADKTECAEVSDGWDAATHAGFHY